MEIVLIVGILIAGIIGAALVLLYAKGSVGDALIPGVIAGLIVIVLGFFVADLTITANALGVAVVLGVIAQLILPKEKVEGMFD